MSLRLLLLVLGSSVVAGCLQVKTDAIEVKPIHITVDVNVRVERALDDFFGDLDRRSTTLTASHDSTSAK
jgi:hypothetical protein